MARKHFLHLCFAWRQFTSREKRVLCLDKGEETIFSSKLSINKKIITTFFLFFLNALSINIAYWQAYTTNELLNPGKQEKTGRWRLRTVLSCQNNITLRYQHGFCIHGSVKKQQLSKRHLHGSFSRLVKFQTWCCCWHVNICCGCWRGCTQPKHSSLTYKHQPFIVHMPSNIYSHFGVLKNTQSLLPCKKG